MRDCCGWVVLMEDVRVVGLHSGGVEGCRRSVRLRIDDFDTAQPKWGEHEEEDEGEREDVHSYARMADTKSHVDCKPHIATETS